MAIGIGGVYAIPLSKSLSDDVVGDVYVENEGSFLKEEICSYCGVRNTFQPIEKSIIIKVGRTHC